MAATSSEAHTDADTHMQYIVYHTHAYIQYTHICTHKHTSRRSECTLTHSRGCPSAGMERMQTGGERPPSLFSASFSPDKDEAGSQQCKGMRIEWMQLHLQIHTCAHARTHYTHTFIHVFSYYPQKNMCT